MNTPVKLIALSCIAIISMNCSNQKKVVETSAPSPVSTNSSKSTEATDSNTIKMETIQITRKPTPPKRSND